MARSACRATSGLVRPRPLICWRSSRSSTRLAMRPSLVSSFAAMGAPRAKTLSTSSTTGMGTKVLGTAVSEKAAPPAFSKTPTARSRPGTPRGITNSPKPRPRKRPTGSLTGLKNSTSRRWAGRIPISRPRTLARGTTTLSPPAVMIAVWPCGPSSSRRPLACPGLTKGNVPTRGTVSASALRPGATSLRSPMSNPGTPRAHSGTCSTPRPIARPVSAKPSRVIPVPKRPPGPAPV